MRRPITFTVSDLLDELQQFDPDAEVRLATQPSWPFEWSLSNIDPAVEVDLDGQPVVYLVNGKQLGYLPGAVRMIPVRSKGWSSWFAPPRVEGSASDRGDWALAPSVF